jgi:hypothetical protein
VGRQGWKLLGVGGTVCVRADSVSTIRSIPTAVAPAPDVDSR